MKMKNLAKILGISFLSAIVFVPVTIFIAGTVGTLAIGTILKYGLGVSSGGENGFWAMLLMFGAFLICALIGAFFALFIHFRIVKKLIKRYEKNGFSLGSHPVLKITLLTWGIIIAAVFLLKLLAG